MLIEHQTTKPERISELTRAAWMNCKTDVSSERWNSRVECHGKNDQSRKKLDKLTIYLLLNRIPWTFWW